MTRLSGYLLRLFSFEAMALFGVAAFMLFLIQCLRLFDLVSDRGQNLLTLLGQALLGMPALGIVFLYVCLGIGLGRALRNLQASSELQIIHAGAMLGALYRAVGLYTLGGTLVLLVLAHVVDPMSVGAINKWSASIAADLVSRSMIPHRFTRVVNGVSMVIGSRDSEGNIVDFFADDVRDGDTRRTYFAKSAIITRDEKGFVLRMQKGAVQYFSADERFSQVSFDRYDLPLDQLTGTIAQDDPLAQSSSIDLIAAAVRSGKVTPDLTRTLLRRSGEGLRVLAMCALVVGLAAFPTGKRRRIEVPIEFAVLGAAFLERALTSYLPKSGVLDIGLGSLLLLGAAILINLIRLRVFRSVGFKRAVA